MRHQDCLIYAQLLNRLREGYHTQEDLQVLQSRLIQADDISYPLNALQLFRTNDAVAVYNLRMFTASDKDKY
jgi:hypothetical protein